MIQSKPVTLTDVQLQFQQWRSTKTAGAKIPDLLWELTAKLLASQAYKITNIGKALGISTRQFRDKFPGHVKTKSKISSVKPKTPSTFVQAPLNTVFMPSSPVPQLVIEKANGTKLSFSTVDQAQFALLIHTLMEQSL